MAMATVGRSVRVIDVTVVVRTPPGHVPSSDTLGRDLRNRLGRRVANALAEEAELIKRAHRCAVMLLDAWVLNGIVNVEIVRERPGDGLVGVRVEIGVGA